MFEAVFGKLSKENSFQHSADGRNPASVDMVNIPVFTGFHTCQVVAVAGFLNHQQYYPSFQEFESWRNMTKMAGGHLVMNKLSKQIAIFRTFPYSSK